MKKEKKLALLFAAMVAANGMVEGMDNKSQNSGNAEKVNSAYAGYTLAEVNFNDNGTPARPVLMAATDAWMQVLSMLSNNQITALRDALSTEFGENNSAIELFDSLRQGMPGIFAVSGSLIYPERSHIAMELMLFIYNSGIIKNQNILNEVYKNLKKWCQIWKNMMAPEMTVAETLNFSENQGSNTKEIILHRALNEFSAPLQEFWIGLDPRAVWIAE